MGALIKNVNTNILTLLLSICLLSLTTTSNTLQVSSEGKPLREILEEFRKNNNINLIYSDELIDAKLVNESKLETFKKNDFENFLDQFGISFKKFGVNTFVLYKKDEEKSEKIVEKIITEEAEPANDSLELVFKPSLLANPRPSYPPQAVKEKIEGSVRIKFLVGEDGRVTQSEVLATSGHSILDSAAREFVYNLRYSPAEKDGEPFSTWSSIIFRYVLEEKDDKQIPQVSY